MKAIQIVKPGELRIIDMEKPHTDIKNNVLVKIKAAGICLMLEFIMGQMLPLLILGL